MLLAELQKKVAHQFECPTCGDVTNPAAQLGIEDALTSYVFGTLRYLPPEAGIIPVLNAAGVMPGAAHDFEIILWPFDTVLLDPIGEVGPTPIGVEPDVIVMGGGLVVCVEAKLGSRLGADPLQLPKEVIHVAREARALGLDWRLVCLTADPHEPWLSCFEPRGGRLSTSGQSRVADAVASYFAASSGDGWPRPDDVRSRVSWISWSHIHDALGASQEGAPPWCRRAVDDLRLLLGRKGLVPPKFHGFRLSTPPLPDGIGAIWAAEVREHVLWESMGTADFPAIPTLWSSTVDCNDKALWAGMRDAVLPTSLPPIWRTA